MKIYQGTVENKMQKTNPSITNFFYPLKLRRFTSTCQMPTDTLSSCLNVRYADNNIFYIHVHIKPAMWEYAGTRGRDAEFQKWRKLFAILTIALVRKRSCPSLRLFPSICNFWTAWPLTLMSLPWIENQVTDQEWNSGLAKMATQSIRAVFLVLLLLSSLHKHSIYIFAFHLELTWLLTCRYSHPGTSESHDGM